jgi:hypothetical protein
MILSQNDVNIVCFQIFAKVMQYISKFQKICYGAHERDMVLWDTMRGVMHVN